MAQQITIDIVAETKKLTQGINDASSQVESMNSKFKGLASAATAAASAFVLKEGISFLKEGIDEAKAAELAMNGATSAFGAGSAALQKITADAEKFGKQIAVDNDDIIVLATQLGSRLPSDSKKLSAELVNLGYDVQAFTAGAITAEAFTSKLAKAFADGQLTAKEMTKIVPGLDDATYKMAETMSKAGKNQEALTLLIEAGQKKYGDAAEKNVTASQKFDVALANLKETIGTKILPIVVKFTDALVLVIDKFASLPGPIQNVILVLTGLIGIGGPFLGFLASAKTAMATLGITTGEYTVAQRLANFTIMGFPGLWVIAAITAVIAVGVLLYKNWDTVKEYAQKLWDKITDVFDWVRNNWPTLLAILTGPFGLAIKYVIDHFDEIKDKITEVISWVKNSLTSLPSAFANAGTNLITGFWNGITSMASWLKSKVTDFFGNLIPSWAKKILGISSPSKVFAAFGEQIVAGLAQGINTAQDIAKNATFNLGNSTISGFRPQLAGAANAQAPISIVINAGLGTDPYKLGREVNNAISKYGKVSNKVVRV